MPIIKPGNLLDAIGPSFENGFHGHTSKAAGTIRLILLEAGIEGYSVAFKCCQSRLRVGFDDSVDLD